MNDLIREAVGYADGWSVIDGLDLVQPPFGVVQPVESMGQGYRDALAAQLVHQIEAFDYYVSVYGSMVTIEFEYYELEYMGERGKRTENTLNACVQFYRERNDGD